MAYAATRNPKGKISQAAVVDLREALHGALLQPSIPDMAKYVRSGMA